MLVGLLIALVTYGPAGPSASDGGATEAPARGWMRLDLVDPFGRVPAAGRAAPRKSRPRGGMGTTAMLDLKDPFGASPDATTTGPAPRPSPASDLRDPFEGAGTVHGDEPGCPSATAPNGAKIQRPAGLGPVRCTPRGRPHLVNPFARVAAR
jgi:hypothetical protein